MKHIERVGGDRQVTLLNSESRLGAARMKDSGPITPDIWCVTNCHWDCYCNHINCHIDCISCF